MNLTPVLSSSPVNSNVGLNNSWIDILNDQDRILCAQATYTVNALGKNGFIFANHGAGTVNGEFVAIHFIQNTILDSIDAANSSTAGVAGVTFPANFTLYGPIFSFAVNTGAVIAYKA